MSQMRLGYKKFGLDLVSLGEDHSHHPKEYPIEEEKRDDGDGDPINSLLKESLK